VEVQPPQAGLHLVCWFPPEMDDQRISQRAGARGLEVMPLSRLALGSLQRGGLVLGYAHAMRNEFDL
jgi:GntR family transcriptional regulator / MocR family aminotransferase